jgi:hypothetical protein
MRRGENRVKTGVKSTLKTGVKATEDRVKTGECNTPTPPRLSPSLEVGPVAYCEQYGRGWVYFERSPYIGPWPEGRPPSLWCYDVTLGGHAPSAGLLRIHRPDTASLALLRRRLGCCGLERGRHVFRSALTPPRPRRRAALPFTGATAGDLLILAKEEASSAQLPSAAGVSSRQFNIPPHKSKPDSRAPGRAAGSPLSPAEGVTDAYCH